MDVCITRRPIFNERKETYGYELLFRSGFEDYHAAMDSLSSSESPDAPTDAGDFVKFDELTGGKVGLVHFTPDLLKTDLPALFPSDTIIVELPPELNVDEETVALCRKLKGSGYALAMDDVFLVRNRKTDLAKFADIIKVDFPKAAADQRDAIIRRISAEGSVMMAQNVESAEEFDLALARGYSLFQGEFFVKPAEQPGQKIAGTKLAYLQILREVNRPDISYDDLEAAIKRDVDMTYRLLRTMNSAWFGLKYQVESVKHALVLLGPKEIKQWFSMVVIRDSGMDKPDELLLRTLCRAKMGELLAPMTGLKDAASELFLMGMFSLIDALTDMPMMDVLSDLPISERVKAALLGQPGPFRTVFETVISYEAGDWEWFTSSTAALGAGEKEVSDIFRKAMSWAETALRDV